MRKFDMDEQYIHDMFSKNTVDSSKIAEEVKERLHKESAKVIPKLHRRWTWSIATAIVMSVALVVGAAAAALGSFDWFIEKFNPDFGKVVEPVEVYSEDQGIRMEVIGAQKYDNMAIVYLSIQDVTGENRLTERTDFKDGFSVKMNQQKQKTTKGVDEVVSESVSWRQKKLYFDEDTNTIYYEFQITADPRTPLADPLRAWKFPLLF